MAVFPEYDSFDALGLAELVRKRELSPIELVDAAIERIARRNPRLNAVIHESFERARRSAALPLPDGPFRGVPFLLKDLLAAQACEPLGSGSRFYEEYVPTTSAEIVNRFERAGLVILGKTNTPELGLVPVTEPERHGPTLNPWNHARTPGGSSGGSASAVASRMVPMASGGDGGGSLRIPASCCGLFGLKPTRGRVPTGPFDGERWEGFTVEHVLTRSVRDSAAALDATAGPDSGAPYYLPAPTRPFLAEVARDPGRLRIAVTTLPLLTTTLHADCQQAVENAVKLLEQLGHEVVEGSPVIDASRFKRSMTTMLAGQVAADVRDAEELVGRQPRFRDFEATTWLSRVLGETFTAGEYQSSVRALARIARVLTAFTDHFDVWLTPTLAAPPLELAALGSKGAAAWLEPLVARLELGRLVRASGVLEQLAERVYGFMPYTPLANATGQPAMSLPLHWNEQGLPIGVMFTARYGDEATLFRLAGQLERAHPWQHKTPADLA